MHITDLKNCPENYWELDKKFNAYFRGVHINYFLDSLVGVGLFSFDIVKFDKYYKKAFGDYEKGKTSLKDAINKKFGKKAVRLIETLIN